jgi:two-component system alkaline phosphatase synthesis response regulator PhoP
MLQPFARFCRLLSEESMDHRLLIIKDGVRSPSQVTDDLRGRGFTVATASNFEFTVDPGLADSFDLIVIDHTESKMSATDICAELRQRNVEAPLMVLTPCDQVQHRIAIFKAGADDYLVKPVNPDELQVRIEALLSRSSRHKKQDLSSYEFGAMRLDLRQSELFRNGSKIELSERETRLLRFLIENRGKTVSRNALLQHVWGYRQAPLTRTVDVHILRLRNKIEDDPKDPQFIITVHGLGYRFNG